VELDVTAASTETWHSLASFFETYEPDCYCGWPRCQPREFVPGKSPNREAMRAIIDSGECPGLLAFLEGEVVGWCAVSPVERYPQYQVSEPQAWGLACLLVAGQARKRGVGGALIEAAVMHAESHGASCVYGPPPWWWPGTEELCERLVCALLKHGFEKVGAGARIPVLRKQLRPS